MKENSYGLWSMSIKNAATAYISGQTLDDPFQRPTVAQVCKDFGLEGRQGDVLDEIARMRGEYHGR